MSNVNASDGGVNASITSLSGQLSELLRKEMSTCDIKVEGGVMSLWKNGKVVLEMQGPLVMDLLFEQLTESAVVQRQVQTVVEPASEIVAVNDNPAQDWSTQCSEKSVSDARPTIMTDSVSDWEVSSTESDDDAQGVVGLAEHTPMVPNAGNRRIAPYPGYRPQVQRLPWNNNEYFSSTESLHNCSVVAILGEPHLMLDRFSDDSVSDASESDNNGDESQTSDVSPDIVVASTLPLEMEPVAKETEDLTIMKHAALSRYVPSLHSSSRSLKLASKSLALDREMKTSKQTGKELARKPSRVLQASTRDLVANRVSDYVPTPCVDRHCSCEYKWYCRRALELKERMEERGRRLRDHHSARRGLYNNGFSAYDKACLAKLPDQQSPFTVVNNSYKGYQWETEVRNHRYVDVEAEFC